MKFKILLGILTISTLFASSQEIPSLFAQEESIQVHIKPYTSEESNLYLNHDLPSRGIQPFEITIDNPTPNQFYVSEEPINLPQVSASKIALKITKSSIPRSIAYKIASLFFWPIAIPGTIDSIRTLKKHKSMKRDFTAKALQSEESIAQYSSLHRIVFVKIEDYTQPLIVTLIDKTSQAALAFEQESGPQAPEEELG